MARSLSAACDVTAVRFTTEAVRHREGEPLAGIVRQFRLVSCARRRAGKLRRRGVLLKTNAVSHCLTASVVQFSFFAAPAHRTDVTVLIPCSWHGSGCQNARKARRCSIKCMQSRNAQKIIPDKVPDRGKLALQAARRFPNRHATGSTRSMTMPQAKTPTMENAAAI